MSKELFNIALNLTLKYEGGYVFNKNDPGGETNKGIIKKEYDLYRTKKGLPIQSVKDITDLEVEDIYYSEYWIAGNCENIASVSDKLAVAHFDTAVNTGIGQATRFLQRAVGAVADGMIGPGTLKALITNFKDDTVENYLQQREAFYRLISTNNPNLKEFLNGWLIRVNSLRVFVAGMTKDNNMVVYCGSPK